MGKKIQQTCLKPLELVPGAKVTEDQKQLLCKIVHCEDWNDDIMKGLYKSDKDSFNYILNNVTTILALEDLDRYMERVGVIYPESTKNSLWQHNHVKILKAISTLTYDVGRFPTRVEISNRSNLSKQTVNKHLKTYFNSDLYNEKKEEFIILREAVLANVFALAMDGDTKASKVFLDATNQFTEAPKVKNQQNNFIQINGLTITQETLQQLPAGKITQLQKILSAVNKPISKQ
jgi:hypothetical protein